MCIRDRIKIDLGKECLVSGIRYLARQDGSYNGAIAGIKIIVSLESESSSNTEFKTIFKKNKKVQEFSFKPTRGRFVTLLPMSEVNGKPWASAAEIGIVGE